MPLFFAAVVLAVPGAAHARWSEKSEFPSAVEIYQAEYRVEKSGRFTETIHLQTRVNNESGKSAGNFRMVYNSANSEARIVAAAATTAGRETKVPGRYVEDKEIPANVTGSDRLRQLVVSFQDVQVGSLLDIEYVVERKVPEIPGYFRYGFFPLFSGYVEKLQVVIRSELPLRFEKGDSRGLLQIEAGRDGDGYVYTLRNRSPLAFATQEERDPYFPPEEESYAVFSSAADYPDLARKIIPLIEKKYAYSPGDKLKGVIAGARRIESPAEQINFITDWVIGEFRYLMDYKKEHSGNVPRDLEEILATRFGDCKDFSLLTTFLLRQLGYKAHTAWVHRGMDDGFFSRTIAFDSFNHAIVFASKDGRSFWVDPTNRVNFAQGIFPDIANRPALVLDPESPRVEQTAELPPEKNRFSLAVSRELGGEESGSRYRFSFLDAGAVGITGLGNHRSPRQIKYSLLRSATEERNVLSYEADAGDLKSRTVSDVNIQLKVRERNTPIKSSAGLGVALASDPRIDKILGIATAGRVSGLNLGPPYLAHDVKVFRGLDLIGRRPRGCKVDSPWIRAERKVELGKGTIRVEDTVTGIKKFFLSPELQGGEFRALQKSLNECFKDVYVIYKPAPGHVKR